MKQAIQHQVVELLRETFEGALPGEGTQYLDHDSGIRPTLSKLTAAQASKRVDGRPSIAAHARHMAFHLRVTSEWIRGDHKPPRLARELRAADRGRSGVGPDPEGSRGGSRGAESYPRRALPERFVEEGGGLGAVAHLAYHLGAIRQIMHRV
jgi:hypothetical protein